MAEILRQSRTVQTPELNRVYSLAEFRNDALANQVRRTNRGKELRERFDLIYNNGLLYETPKDQLWESSLGQVSIVTTPGELLGDLAFLRSHSSAHRVHFVLRLNQYGNHILELSLKGLSQNIHF